MGYVFLDLSVSVLPFSLSGGQMDSWPLTNTHKTFLYPKEALADALALLDTTVVILDPLATARV